MKKTFKTCIATLIAMATLMTGLTGIVASAAETENNETSIVTGDLLPASSKSY